MSLIKVNRLVSPTDEQLEQIVALRLRAYSKTDPSQKALYGGDWSLRDAYARAMIRSTALDGEIYVVTDETARVVVSVGLWFAPGKSLFGTEEQRSLGFNDFFQRLSPETKDWWTRTQSDVMSSLIREIWTEEEQNRRWWCAMLATEPEYQGRGLATAIMNFAYDKIANAGQFLGLATALDINVAKYRSMGLALRGNRPMPAPTGDFTVFVMSKTPSTLEVMG